MTKVLMHPAEKRRLIAVERYKSLFDDSGLNLEQMTQIACMAFGVPVSAITLLEEEIQTYKAILGLDLKQTPRSDSFCAHAILQEDVFVVTDLKADTRFKQNILVTSAPFLRFYAGAPLITKDGLPLGTLCILDTNARQLSAEQKLSLQNLAQQIVQLLEARLQYRETYHEATHLRSLAYNMTSGIVAVKPDKNIAFVNPAFCEMFQMNKTPEDLVGKPAISLLDDLKKHHPQPSVTAARVHEILSARQMVVAEELTFNGGLRFERDYVPLFRDGAYEGHLWIYKDVTSKKKNEEKLSNALERAEVAVQAKSDFLANVSHEIRTPLNGILNLSDFLLESSLSPEQFKIAKNVKNCGSALLEIVNDILDYSKIDAKKFELEFQSFNLQGSLNKTIEILIHKAAQKNLNLIYKIESALPEFISGDQERLQQILFHLVGNAIKFTSHGQILVRISALPTKRGHLLQFEISDTGIGIPQDRIPTLFQSFMQIDSSTSRKFGGTGLGLAISKSLIELMGGKINLKSEMGRGTTFFFTAEVLHSEIPQNTRSAPLACTSEMLSYMRNQTPRVLVAEDNSVNMLVTTNLLKKIGYLADVAKNGAEALELATCGNYDFILMDVQMPEMSGLEATTSIRKLALVKNPTIIALTANGRASDEEKCKDAGMDDFLTKPVRFDNLAEKMHTWLKKKAA